MEDSVPNPVLIMDYANMYCGAAPDAEAASNHLVLTEVKLPALDVVYAEHRAAGAPIPLEISTAMAHLECTFVMVGLTPQVMELLDSWITSERHFFIYGNVRDQLTGIAYQAAAAFVGQLGRADPTNWRKGDVGHTNYAIRGISHYEYMIADDPVYYWDFFNNMRIVGGANQNIDINSNLMVSTAGPEYLLRNFQEALNPQ